MPIHSKYMASLNDVGNQANHPPLADRTALAQVVAAGPTDPVLLLDRDNGPDRWVSLTAAVDLGTAFAVKVSDRLLAIDADNPGDQYMRLLELLAASYIPHIELASGGAAHRRHLWLVLGDIAPDLHQALATAVRSLGLDVRTCGSLIRPPLTPHRTGTMPTMLTPLSAVQAVAVLAAEGCGTDRVKLLLDGLSQATPEILVTPEIVATPTAGLLPERTRVLLNERDPQYETRSEQLRAVLVSLANHRWTETAVLDLVLPSLIGAKARGKPDPRSWLADQYRSALRWVAEHPALSDRTETRVLLARCRAAAASWVWDRGMGSAPGTLSRVLGGLLDVAADACVLTVSVSVRQLAERSGVGRSAAMRALQVLIEQKVLKRLDGSRGTDAAVYRVNTNHPVLAGVGGTQGDTKPDTPLMISSVPLPTPPLDDPRSWLPDHDGWRHRGLGASALRVAQHLDANEPLTRSQIAASCGFSLGWTRVLLRRLRSAELIIHTADGWLAVSPDMRSDALRCAAQRYGTDGVGRRQSELHEAERKGYHAWRAVRLAPIAHVEDVEAGIVRLIHRDTGELLGSKPLDATPTIITMDNQRARS